MLGISKPKNRRKQERKRFELPSFDWRRIGVSVLSVGGVLAAVFGIIWSLDQPIETVAVEGRFQRVQAVDVEQAVKDRVRGAGAGHDQSRVRAPRDPAIAVGRQRDGAAFLAARAARRGDRTDGCGALGNEWPAEFAR